MRTAFLLVLAGSLLAQAPPAPPAPIANLFRPAPGDPQRDARELRLKNVRQLTREGSNAEAYWSFKGDRIIFQSTRDGSFCDQLYTMKADGSEQKRVSSGKGRVTCGYFLPGDQKIIYASTHAAGDGCPPTPRAIPGSYRWPVLPSFDLYLANADGSEVRPFLAAPGYDAEATVAPNGKWIVFTSERGGDIDLYRVDLDGSHLLRLTDRVGYDGGGVFSNDSKLIAWRASYPGADKLGRYQELLKEHLVEPMDMDIWVMSANGSGKRQVTRLKGVAFAPIFAPGDKAIVFASNHHDRGGLGRTFDLFKVDLDGSHLEQLTFTGDFNSFPHFSPDGKKLLFVSGRFAKSARQFNIFIADWVK